MGGSSIEIAYESNLKEEEVVEVKKVKFEKWQTEGREGMCVLPDLRVLDNKEGLWCVAWSPVDDTIITGSRDGVVKTWHWCFSRPVPLMFVVVD